MKLNQNELSLAVHGAVETEQRDGYTFFLRFTKKQREYYATTEFSGKEWGSSGMYLEFVTDAERLRFEYKEIKASSQCFYYFDLFINGKMVTHVGTDSYDGAEEGIYDAALPAGEKTVRLYFPNLSGTGIRNVELMNATVFRPTEKKLNYVAYGDSITQGYTAKEPSLTYVNLLGAALDADVYDLGIGGERFQPLMIDENYPVAADLVTVAYGTNDWCVLNAENGLRQMKEFLQKLTQVHKDSVIYVILPIWRGNGAEDVQKALGTLEEYRAILREEAGKYEQITVIEGIDLVPHHADFYIKDQLHPNALGFTQYAKNLLNEIKASNRI